MRRGAFVVLALGFAVAPASLSLASCSHGGYDGSFDSSGLEILATQVDAGSGPPVTQAVAATATGTTTVTTGDGVFQIDVPAHAFPSDVTITVTPLAERTIDNGYIVPTFGVTVTPAITPTLPVQIVFHGNVVGTGGTPTTLAPVALAGDAGAAPLLVFGGGANTGGAEGPSGQLWALVTTLGGTYSLAYVATPTNQNFVQTTQASCLSTCCNANHNTGGAGNAQVYATKVGCACLNVAPPIDCFVQNCPDLPLVANECVGLTTEPKGQIPCPSSGPGAQTTCNAPSNGCCYQPGGGSGNPVCTPSNNSCGYSVRCGSDSSCPDAGVCCAFEGEALCAPSCPPERRLCALDAGACAQCAKAGQCPFAVCGKVPDVCK